ncbi:cytoplasmic protein [Mesorhizobium sp. CAU 1741]|uniref:cytoplasmic protein n=1 Tax=Mesorhizobium sp. CAU 1741 TaxID=3140366 RepID=UPI00325B26DF
MGLHEEIGAFRRSRAADLSDARQRAALFILAGIELSDLASGSASGQHRLIARLRRLIERERQRGIRRHWSYDLNRHIALKQALDRLSSDGVCSAHSKKAVS